jgi:hypothetical protein
MFRQRRSIFSILAAVLFATVGLSSLRAQGPTIRDEDIVVPTERTIDPNAAVLEAVRTMPIGGRYAASQAAFEGLGRALSLGYGGLNVDAREAQPSFCSGATYLVFVQALEELARNGSCTLDPQILHTLVVAHQRDGQGVWGRWNANGPGTARLFTELGLGRNFTEFSAARPGDFMKIFWTEEIGQKEHGHSVVYLGSATVGGKEFVRFWSSNMASDKGDLSGYGYKLIPRTKIVRSIFSRFENPTNIARVRTLAATDPFLASLLSRRVTIDEVRRMCEL